jgi:hypothetical protein
MKKNLVIAAFVAFSGLAYAEQNPAVEKADKCLAVVTQHYEDLAAARSNFGFENLTKLTRAQAASMTEEALIESRSEEKNQQKMRKLLKNKAISFYEFYWSAPSNTGSTIVAAKKSNCEVVNELFYSSEE